ncbi:histidine kinase dimerization/phospho-acceptor domain-containing protein [Bacillus sp. 1P06AnD]|uniref:sensor histidine kinase n=1 Tax=Bacillus sp. 1P06AnD TaxID=3132208 RepID=UPI0039A13666
MDTKWKNNKKLGWSILLMVIGFSFLLMIINSEPSALKGNYFQSSSFMTQYSSYMDRLKLAVLGDYTEENLEKRIVVTEDDINQHRYEYGDLGQQMQNIKDQYASKINQAEDNGDKQLADIYRKERDQKLEDITLNFTSDEHVKEKILSQRKKVIENAMEQISSEKEIFPSDIYGFEYYFKDMKTGKIFTSLSPDKQKKYKDYFTDEKNMLFFEDYGVNNKSLMYMENNPFYYSQNYDQQVDLKNERKVYQGFVGFPKNAAAASPIMQEYKQYESITIVYRVLAVAGALLSLIGLAVYVKSAFWRVEQGAALRAYDRIPVDVRIAALCLACMFIFFSYHFYAGTDLSFRELIKMGFTALYFMAVTAFIILLFTQIILCFMKKGLEKEWQDSFVYRLYSALRNVFLNMHMAVQLFLLLIIVFGMGMGFILAFIVFNASMDLVVLYFIMCLFIGLPALYLIFKQIGNLNRIMLMVNGLSRGYQEDDIKIRGTSPIAKMARDVNTLKSGIRSSQTAQVKSERLKTELITNVSHDLRTPLTSIITYTDLLKSSDLSEDDRKAYIDIIDRKSKRLKVLIEDLFEASKMATGNIELDRRNVELVQMLQQTLAEHNEGIESSNLIFRVVTDEQPINAYVDGQKLHRVFDNLIVNALKYSLPHTRVYISMLNKENTVEISFKNISQYEMGGNIDELFERFKRGDTSRHTEGSGLGLAIAKSIIDLHGGELNLDVDGDLFKVTIILSK